MYTQPNDLSHGHTHGHTHGCMHACMRAHSTRTHARTTHGQLDLEQQNAHPERCPTCRLDDGSAVRLFAECETLRGENEQLHRTCKVLQRNSDYLLHEQEKNTVLRESNRRLEQEVKDLKAPTQTHTPTCMHMRVYMPLTQMCTQAFGRSVRILEASPPMAARTTVSLASTRQPC